MGWNKYPNFYSNTSKNGSSIANCWDSGQKTEDLGIKRPLFDRELGNLVNLVEFLNSWAVSIDHDTMRWKLDSLASYVAKSTFLMLTNWEKTLCYPLVNRNSRSQKKVEFLFGHWLIQV